MSSKSKHPSPNESALRPIRLAALPAKIQYQLVADLVEAREPELRLAYPGVIDICIGNKSVTKNGVPQVSTSRRLSVVFVVKEKFSSRQLEYENVLSIPKHLTTFLRQGGKRHRVLVPTDVEPIRDLQGAYAHASPSPIMVDWGNDAVSGTGQLCAVVRFSNGPKMRKWAIGCRHVLSRITELAGGVNATGSVQLAYDPGPDIGRTSVMAGLIRPKESGSSFDAQLVTVLDEGRLHTALRDLRFSPVEFQPEGLVSAEGTPPRTFFAHTERGPIEIEFDVLSGSNTPPEITYDTADGSFRAVHEELVVFEFKKDAPLKFGDSGAPVSTEKSGGKLVGMHIAGDSDRRRSYVIPAWHLLDPARYGHAAKRLVVIDPEELPAAEPASLPDAEAFSSVEIGTLSRKYEVGNRGPGTVSTGVGDRGGISYGSYQFSTTTGSAQAFVDAVGLGDRFNGAEPGTAEFTRAWRELATEDPVGFERLQHDYVNRAFFMPFVQKILEEDNIDVSSRSAALKDVVWSTAVQHGPQSSIVHRAVNGLGEDDRRDDRKVIIAIYAERGRRAAGGSLVHFSRSSREVQESVARRFVDEQDDALAMLQNA